MEHACKGELTKDDDDKAGSRRQCLHLTEGEPSAVAQRLSRIAAPFATVDAAHHHWCPSGFSYPGEAQLHKRYTPAFLSGDHPTTMQTWWLATGNANTPNWDIAATAQIDGRQGVLLVEAKAHAEELSVQDRSRAKGPSRHHITAALAGATAALRHIYPDAGWNLRIDTHYQLANRVAWAWKIATLGYPVVLVYLGFLAVHDKPERKPFASAANWEEKMRAYSQGCVPWGVWHLPGEEPKPLMVQDGNANAAPLYLLIRTSHPY